MDYRDFSRDGAAPQRKLNGDQPSPWWMIGAPKEEVDVADGKLIAQSVTSSLNFLATHQRQRGYQYVVSTRLYGNMALMGFYGFSSTKMPATYAWLNGSVRFNVCQAVVDTVTAKISEQEPVPYFVTDGADFKVQRRAKKLTAFCGGVFAENEAHRIGALIFRDAAVFGDGIIHVFERDGRVKLERVLAHELFVDEVEALYGSPRQMHRVKSIDRSVLLQSYPDCKDIILDATPSMDDNKNYPNIADSVSVRESWHLPSSKTAADGRHVISIAAGLLLDEPWKRESFPFAIMRWCPRLVGFWSQGLVEQIQSIQSEINKLLWLIQRSFHLAGTYKVLMEMSSKVVPEHLNADIGAIIKYQGTKPEYIVPPTVQPEIFQQYRQLKQDAFEQAGVSQLQATAQKPAGLNSGEAIRSYNDIQTDRFATISKAYSNFYLDVARLVIATAKEITSRRSYTVKAKRSGGYLSTISWADVKLDEDAYLMKMFSTANLPNEPSARQQTISEWVQAGMVTPRQAKRLLAPDSPLDLRELDSLQSAAEDYLTGMFDALVDDGVPATPDPLDDLQLAMEMTLEYYERGKTQGLEPERLDLLRRYMDMVKVMLTPPPAPAASVGMGAPQATPVPPPQSPLIPNVPGVVG